MNNDNRKQAYKKAFESQNIPSDLSSQCAEILVNDDTRSRTSEEQELINKAWSIAFGVSK